MNFSGITGMNPGRDGRQNYGPSSPPTGSLPPFYESLKGGNNASNQFNANGNYNNYNLISAPLHMDCDTGQEMSNMGYNGGQSPPKQYSMLQNASYGLVMKDEADLDNYDSKLDPMGNLLQGGYPSYDDAMMVDVVTGAVVDPLQFTALTFPTSAEHALLESLSDAADLSSFLQRLPNDEETNDNGDIITGDMNSPSLTPDSVQIQNVEQNMEGFPEHVLNRNYENPRHYLAHQQFSKIYQENLPSYQQVILLSKK